MSSAVATIACTNKLVLGWDHMHNTYDHAQASLRSLVRWIPVVAA